MRPHVGTPSRGLNGRLMGQRLSAPPQGIRAAQIHMAMGAAAGLDYKEGAAATAEVPKTCDGLRGYNIRIFRVAVDNAPAPTPLITFDNWLARRSIS